MDFTVKIKLHANRWILGQATVETPAGDSVLGPFPCLAISDNAAATAHHNPTHDPLMPFGNTPTGLYSLVLLPKKADTAGYGDQEVFLIVPISGDGVRAESEPGMRSGLLFHGGAFNNAYTWWGGLRPTYGCVRFADVSMKAMIERYKANTGSTWRALLTESAA